MNILLRNFINLNEEEIQLVWRERNKETIREKMYNSDLIPIENHLKWISSLVNKTDCKYFIVYFDDAPVGVIDFTKINSESCEIGAYAFEEFINYGYGIILEIIILKFAFEKMNLKEVYCTVLETNKSVYNMHIKYFGFNKDESLSSSMVKEGKILNFKGLKLPFEKWQNFNNPKLNKVFDFLKIDKIIWEE